MTAVLLWGRQCGLAVACAVATCGSGALNQALKHLFQRIRPEHVHGYANADGWSFPSGHASAALAVYGFACYLALRVLPPRWHAPCLAAAAALVTAIGASRVLRSEEHTSELQSLMRISYAVFCLKKKKRSRN